jgi:hypothetical protein
MRENSGVANERAGLPSAIRSRTNFSSRDEQTLRRSEATSPPSRPSLLQYPGMRTRHVCRLKIARSKNCDLAQWRRSTDELLCSLSERRVQSIETSSTSEESLRVGSSSLASANSVHLPFEACIRRKSKIGRILTWVTNSSNHGRPDQGKSSERDPKLH